MGADEVEQTRRWEQTKFLQDVSNKTILSSPLELITHYMEKRA
jgi:hypothetical protein